MDRAASIAAAAAGPHRDGSDGRTPAAALAQPQAQATGGATAIVIHPDPAVAFQEPLLCDSVDDAGRVFIGNVVASASRKCLFKHRITHVVNVTRDKPNTFEASVAYHRVPVEDKASHGWPGELAARLPVAVDFVDSALASSPAARVLVHCNMGTSRSATVVLAWIMRAQGLTLRQALRLVTDRRSPDSYTHPNVSFLEQCLVPWERRLWAEARDRRADAAAAAAAAPAAAPTTEAPWTGTESGAKVVAAAATAATTAAKDGDDGDDGDVSAGDGVLQLREVFRLPAADARLLVGPLPAGLHHLAREAVAEGAPHLAFRDIQIQGRTVTQTRRTAFFGMTGDVAGYGYSGQVTEVLPMPPALVRLTRAVNVCLGTSFNGVLLNHYPAGDKNGIGFHADKAPGGGGGGGAAGQPEAPEPQPLTKVVAISLGGSRVFSLKAKGGKSNKAPPLFTMPTADGQVMVMDGADFQARLLHGIPWMKGAPERWSITFRHHPPAGDAAHATAFTPSLTGDDYYSNHGHGKPFNGKGRKGVVQ